MKRVKTEVIQSLETMSNAEIDKQLAALEKNAVDVVDWREYPYCPTVEFAIARSESYLFVRFAVTERNIKAVSLNDNEAVWEDSCVEFFVKQEDSPFYYNFETNCIGTILAAKRRSKADATHFTCEQLSRIIRIASLPHQPIDCTEGGQWTLILGIPFFLIGIEGELPKTLRANFYKCGDRTAEPHYLSWNPIDNPTPNFHLPEYFGTIEL